MKQKLIFGLVLICLLVPVVLSGCTQSILNPPNFVVMNKSKRDGMSGLDKVGFVDITVRNSGGDGSKTIYVNVIQGDGSWGRGKSLYLKSGASGSVTIEFPEISFWTLDPWYYSVDIT